MARYKVKPERGVHTREVAPPSGQPDASRRIPVYQVVVADRGRLVLPVEIREKLKIKDGDRVSLTLEDDGAVVLQTPVVALRRLQALVAPFRRPGVLESDELIKERRREARKQDRDAREWLATQRRLERHHRR